MEPSKLNEILPTNAKAKKQTKQESRAVYPMKASFPGWSSTSNNTNKACAKFPLHT